MGYLILVLALIVLGAIGAVVFWAYHRRKSIAKKVSQDASKVQAKVDQAAATVQNTASQVQK